MQSNKNLQNAGLLMIVLIFVVLLVSGKINAGSIFALVLWGIMITIFPMLFAPLAILGFIVVLMVDGKPFFAWLQSRLHHKGG